MNIPCGLMAPSCFACHTPSVDCSGIGGHGAVPTLFMTAAVLMHVDDHHHDPGRVMGDS